MLVSEDELKRRVEDFVDHFSKELDQVEALSRVRLRVPFARRSQSQSSTLCPLALAHLGNHHDNIMTANALPTSCAPSPIGPMEHASRSRTSCDCFVEIPPLQSR